jgi:hypothetical protein
MSVSSSDLKDSFRVPARSPQDLLKALRADHEGELMARTTRAIAVVAAAAAVVLGLAACGTPPWEQAGSGDGGKTPSPTQSRIVVIHNDLATGSVKRTLQAGDIKLDINYYSSLDIGKWYATADKPLSLSASASLGSDQGQAVYLSKVTVSTTVQGPKGALPSPAAQTDAASVQPGYFVKAPYAYGPTFIIPPVDKSATSITISIVYELLLQTTPTSSSYAKESASDTLTIALAQP